PSASSRARISSGLPPGSTTMALPVNESPMIVQLHCKGPTGKVSRISVLEMAIQKLLDMAYHDARADQLRRAPRLSTCVELLLQVLHLALQGIDVAGHLRAEGVELGGGPSGGAALALQLVAQQRQFLLQTLDGLRRVLFFQGLQVGTQTLELRTELVLRFTLRVQLGFQPLDLTWRGALEGAQLDAQSLEALIELVGNYALRLQLAIQCFDALVLLSCLNLNLPAHGFKLAIQLAHLQLQGLGAGGHCTFRGDHLARDVLNATGRLLTDAGETFLGG